MRTVSAEVASSTSRPTPAEGWYPGLDGVRGIAVFLVFTIHYVPRLTGYVGWTGVIVFFVLSGFLITGGLYDNRDEPQRFRNFYIRRTLRIFPLFYFVWLCIFITAFFFHERWRPLLVLWPTYLGNYARFIAGTAAVDRIWTSRFAFEIGHFWSLAIEEQFYLLWPLVVFKVRDRRALIRICIGVMVAVLALRSVMVLAIPGQLIQLGFLYRMTFAQADAFLLGGMLALVLRGPGEARLLRWSGRWLGIALAALVIAWLSNAGVHGRSIEENAPWVGAYGFTLLDLTAAGLILCSIHRGSVLFRAFSWGPLRVLGRYSYGFYVYHVILYQPLVGFVLNRWKIPLALLFTVDFFVILGVSAASYHVLEMPFLRLKKRFITKHRNPEAIPAERGDPVDAGLQAAS
jgi:peptidoglycan/LPS O-acetylase OafA/YrhL